MSGDVALTQQIQTALADYLKRKPESILPEHSLRDDLGLDSMATIELLFRIEEVFDLQIPDEDLQKLVTVGNVIAYVESRLKPASGKLSPKRTAKRPAAKKKG